MDSSIKPTVQDVLTNVKLTEEQIAECFGPAGSIRPLKDRYVLKMGDTVIGGWNSDTFISIGGAKNSLAMRLKYEINLRYDGGAMQDSIIKLLEKARGGTAFSKITVDTNHLASELFRLGIVKIEKLNLHLEPG